jgi:hypothetical protein
MTTKSYHTPPQPASARVRCPVCHEVVYSKAGIHPQCAVRQSEPPKVKNVAPVVEPTIIESVDGEPEAVPA